MQIKLLVSAAAIALVASVGSVSAADQFSTLEGITAAAMTPQEMGMVAGKNCTGCSTLTILNAPFEIEFHFPVLAGANEVVANLPNGAVVAGGSVIAVFNPNGG